jgi:cell division septal protein FtsQ
MSERRPTARKVNRRSRATAPRDHLLDVRIRTSTARRRNQETAGRWIRNLLLFAFIVSGSVFGVRFALDRFFFENADYTLRRITLDLDNLLTREQALAEAGLSEGVNIFSVDLAKVEGKLKAIPQVQSAHVARELPDHIKVTLTARNPIAWVAAEGETGDPTGSEKSLLVDASGYLMRPRHLTPEDYHLPVIYGLKSDNMREGEALQIDDMRNALKLLETVAQRPESLLKIRTMDVSKGYRIDVVNDTNSRIIFAASDYEEQLARLQKLLVHCSETGRALETVNLMVRRNTPVTFVMAAAPPVEEQPAPTRPPAKTQQKTRRN